jgi:undecaprenyl-diphosphatase
LAQSILLRALLGWNINPEGSDFLVFLVALHLATATALFIYFWKDWRVVVFAFAGSAKRGKFVYDQASKFAWLLVAGTVVVGFFGLVFEKRLRQLFDDPKKTWIVAAVLVANGFMMLMADVLKRRASAQDKRAAVEAAADDQRDPATDAPSQRRNAEDMTMIEGAAVGATQTLALVPGVSRSGITIVAGLLAGLSYEQACRFSFMLATPVIGLAALLKVPSLFKPAARQTLAITTASALLAGIFAYLSTKFLMRYFRHHRLGPFGWYCIIFGVFALIWLRLS